MPPFEFHAELFEGRGLALEALADLGLMWLSDFSSVDLLHDMYGLEICGIKDEADAIYVETLVQALFPDWPYVSRVLKDYGDRDLGWRVRVCRHRDRPSGPFVET